ncbi:hypothetical protein E2C01_082553 [Portunus trituberculatus]|uniref:Uncharacterized protein n=1 Tax=Portunus trituberculatus TaxID=210409 RepID=A0A5B7IQ89_PORTR|nr:hypothetical protein [Portunus trituberculatus]
MGQGKERGGREEDGEETGGAAQFNMQLRWTFASTPLEGWAQGPLGASANSPRPEGGAAGDGRRRELEGLALIPSLGTALGGGGGWQEGGGRRGVA